MGTQQDFAFEFDFDPGERENLLREARKTLGALRSDLSGEGSAGRGTETVSATERAALDLMSRFEGAVAELSGYPDVLRIEERHFTDHGLEVPARFRDLRRRARFYWIRFPALLKPAPGTVFHKLQCGVHFNPGAGEAHLLPRAMMVLPDRRFQDVLKVDTELELRIGEDFEFVAGTPPVGGGAMRAGAAVDLAGAAKLGAVAGPFTYRWKRALVDHTAPGSEKVFWTFSGAEFTESDELSFVVVLQVPEGVERVEIAGAMRAYHRFDPAADLGDLLSYLRRRVRDFFRAGAPTDSPPAQWDITPSL